MTIPVQQTAISDASGFWSNSLVSVRKKRENKVPAPMSESTNNSTSPETSVAPAASASSWKLPEGIEDHIEAGEISDCSLLVRR